MNKIIRYLLIGVVVVGIAAIMDGFYILAEDQQAVVTQFGRPVGDSITTAGLKFKLPFIQKVTFFDQRILIWDGEPNQIPTNDKTFVHLDTTARWRIVDPLLFLQTVNNEARAQTMLDDIIDGTVRDIVNKNDLVEIIRSSDWKDHKDQEAILAMAEAEQVNMGRDMITAKIREIAGALTPKFGIELVDVMFKRVNYIETVRLKVYERMISERQRIAAEKRSIGEGKKAEIMGKLQRELQEIGSGAMRTSQEIKGKADAKASRIYADAFSQDPAFFAFSKTLDSYRLVLGENTRLILSSDSELFQYLQNIK